MTRRILGLLAGIVVGFLCVLAFQAVSMAIYPAPEGTDLQDPDQLAAFVKTLPVGALLLVIVSHFVGALSAAAVATWIQKARWVPGLVLLGVFFVSASLMNLKIIPHPPWFAGLDLAQYVPAIWLGSRVVPMREDESAGNADTEQ